MTVGEIKSTLSSATHDPHDFYEMMLKRFQEQNQFSRDLAFEALTWLSHAQRPMTALELQHVLAVEAGKESLDVVETLLKQACILPNMKDRNGWTAITCAAIEGQLEVLQLLLSREDAIEALNSAGYSGKSPLDWAITGN